MKKKLFCSLLLCLCFLTACSREQQVSGEIIERSMKEDSGIVSFVIQTDSGKEIGILMTEETWVTPWADGMTADDFKFEEQDGIRVSVSYDRTTRSLVTKSGNEIPAYDAKHVEIREVRMPNQTALSDGTCVDVWQGSNYTQYELTDGTELLREYRASGPANHYVVGIENFDDLSEPAKENVLRFYEEQGLLYNTRDELEQAYAEYLACGAESNFSCYKVEQQISPTASNERILCFLTSVTLPIDEENYTELRLSAVFDRKTGEHLNPWDLFSCDEQTAKQAILDLAGVTDPVLRAEMEAALQPEYIIFFPNDLEVSFPMGTLPSQEYSSGLGLDYDDRLREIMYDWAIPDSADQSA